MTPILFTENSTTFTTNGVGRLSDAISCIVSEDRNGPYELTMEYPSSGIHFDNILIRSIICALPARGKTIQAFRVYAISKPVNGVVTINAQHISYDLSKNTCMPFEVAASSSACNTVLQGIKTNAVETCDFTFWTDVNTVAAYKQTVPSSIRQRLGGIEGSVLDQYGGEYEFDNFTVKLHKNRGTAKNIPLRYGKNITDIQQETNISKTVTGIVPFWVDNEGNNLVTLTEKAVYSSHASSYSDPLTVPMDFSGRFEDQPTQAQLRTAAQDYVSQSTFGVPKVSTKIDFVNLADTEEYKDLLQLQNVYLCDIIPVQFEKLGINTTAKIVSVVFDVLKERYKSVTVGSLRADLSTTITDAEASLRTLSERTRMNFAQMDTEVETAIVNATSWLTTSGGYVIAIKNTDGTWKELLFMDTADTQTAVNVLRINQNGIGFSSNGVNGPFTQAWTLDGKLVIGGTNVPSITVYDNNNNIIFQADATKIIWNATNSSMSSDGTITATGANLTNANIKTTNSQDARWVQIENGGITLGQNNTTLMTITSGGIDTDAFLVDTTGQGYAWPVGTDFGVKSDGDITFETYGYGNDIQFDGYSGVKFSVGGTSKLNLTSKIYAFDDVDINGNVITGRNPNSSGNDAELSFADAIEVNGTTYYDNLTLSGGRLLLNSSDIFVRGTRDSGSYGKGYTGTFNLQTSGGQTATLNFVNGILV